MVYDNNKLALFYAAYEKYGVLTKACAVTDIDRIKLWKERSKHKWLDARLKEIKKIATKHCVNCDRDRPIAIFGNQTHPDNIEGWCDTCILALVRSRKKNKYGDKYAKRIGVAGPVNKEAYKGIHKRYNHNKTNYTWRVKVRAPNGQQFYFGNYTNEDYAASIYDYCAFRIFGPDTYLNFEDKKELLVNGTFDVPLSVKKLVDHVIKEISGNA